MVLKQILLVLEKDSGTHSNTFLINPNLLGRSLREMITEYLLEEPPSSEGAHYIHVPKSGMPSLNLCFSSLIKGS